MHRYRPDIDGLRAIAVLPVVLFHAEIPGFSGGFVGVDIFFVISGYLITSIIVNDIWSRKFSILSFYERRIRRIFPAFFVMIAILTVVGALFLIPSELKDLGSSTFAATLFLSNMLFWYKSGYFDAPSELNPLLHTWSLGVEEQFYLGFPLVAEDSGNEKNVARDSPVSHLLTWFKRLHGHLVEESYIFFHCNSRMGIVVRIAFGRFAERCDRKTCSERYAFSRWLTIDCLVGLHFFAIYVFSRTSTLYSQALAQFSLF